LRDITLKIGANQIFQPVHSQIVIVSKIAVWKTTSQPQALPFLLVSLNFNQAQAVHLKITDTACKAFGLLAYQIP
jgi:hypothetical protein